MTTSAAIMPDNMTIGYDFLLQSEVVRIAFENGYTYDVMTRYRNRIPLTGDSKVDGDATRYFACITCVENVLYPYAVSVSEADNTRPSVSWVCGEKNHSHDKQLSHEQASRLREMALEAKHIRHSKAMEAFVLSPMPGVVQVKVLPDYIPIPPRPIWNKPFSVDTVPDEDEAFRVYTRQGDLYVAILASEGYLTLAFFNDGMNIYPSLSHGVCIDADKRTEGLDLDRLYTAAERKEALRFFGLHQQRLEEILWSALAAIGRRCSSEGGLEGIFNYANITIRDILRRWEPDYEPRTEEEGFTL